MRPGAVLFAILCFGSFLLGCARAPHGTYTKVDHLKSSGADTADAPRTLVSEADLNTAIYPGAKQVAGGNSTSTNGSLSTKIVAFTTQDSPPKIATFYSENLKFSEIHDQGDLVEINGTNEAGEAVRVTTVRSDGEPTLFTIEVTTQTK